MCLSRPSSAPQAFSGPHDASHEVRVDGGEGHVGHGPFGREEADFTWERTDKAAALAAEAGARVRAA